MAKKKFYIVWNPEKNGGFITDDENDAWLTAECYCEDDDDCLPMQEIELEV